MSVYIDTSAIIAILDASDKRHAEAARLWRQLMEGTEQIITSGYAVAETCAVLQARYSAFAVKTFLAGILPMITVRWIDTELHTAASKYLLRCLSRNGPSLVDCTAFEIIRRDDIDKVFAYDRHFAGRGFTLVGE